MLAGLQMETSGQDQLMAFGVFQILDAQSKTTRWNVYF